MGRLSRELVAVVGHEVHLCRALEARRLLAWARTRRGERLLDLAGGDGYWATRAAAHGAHSVCLDLDTRKLLRGARLSHAASGVLGDALHLPFAAGSFDVVLSVCAIEHFLDADRAIAEAARVLVPGGRLLLSADSLTDADLWPRLRDKHFDKYAVVRTYDLSDLRAALSDWGLEIRRHHYLFRSTPAQRLYLGVSAYGGRAGWNLAAPAALWVAVSDARRSNDRGSVLLVEAVRLG